jgi:nitrous oxide reductase accessory protein NosL
MRATLPIAIIAAGALAAGCGSTTKDRVQQDASRSARAALERAGISADDQAGPMSCAQVGKRGKPSNVWRCSADLVSGAQVRCEVHLGHLKANAQRTSCGGALAVDSRTLSY